MRLFILLAMLDLGSGDIRQIKDLGNARFEVRESTHEALAKRLNFPLYRKLKQYVSDDPEIRWRIKCICAPFEEKYTKKYLQKLSDAVVLYPTIDMLPSGYSLRKGKWKTWSRGNIIVHYMQVAQNNGIALGPAPMFPGYRKAAELFMNERLLDEFDRALGNIQDEAALEKAMAAALKEITDDIKEMVKKDNFYQESLKLLSRDGR